MQLRLINPSNNFLKICCIFFTICYTLLGRCINLTTIKDLDTQEGGDINGYFRRIF
jgi:hypothetical protein